MTLSSHFKTLATLSIVCVGAAGNVKADDLFVCGWFSGNIVKCNVDESNCESFVGAGVGGLSLAHSLRIGPVDGNFYVTSIGTNQVLRFNGESGFPMGQFVSAGLGGISAPTMAAFGPDGDLYVTSFNTDSVVVFNGSTGLLVGVRVDPGDGGLDGPESITFGPDDQMYISSRWNHSIKKYDWKTGEYLGDFVESGDGGLTEPFHSTFNDDGTFFYVGSSLNDTIIKYNGSSGDFIEILIQDDPATLDVDESGGLDNPHGVRIGPDGRMYVSSWASDEILAYDTETGEFLEVFLSSGDGVDGPQEVVFMTDAPDVTPGDLDGDKDVDFSDLLALLAAWGPCVDCPEDLDGSEEVGFSDLLILLSNWSS